MQPFLIRVNEDTAVPRNRIILVARNRNTLKTGVFLENGAVVESDKTLDETINEIERASDAN